MTLCQLSLFFARFSRVFEGGEVLGAATTFMLESTQGDTVSDSCEKIMASVLRLNNLSNVSEHFEINGLAWKLASLIQV
jgi:hypothetical protein